MEQPRSKDGDGVHAHRSLPTVPHKYFGKHTYKSVYYSDVTSEIYTGSRTCLEKAFQPGFQYRKAGVILSDLISPDDITTRLFEQMDFERRHSLSKIIDEVNYRYGRDMVGSPHSKLGATGKERVSIAGMIRITWSDATRWAGEEV
jgi:hypothetical protein